MTEGRVPGRYSQKRGGSPALSQLDRPDLMKRVERVLPQCHGCTPVCLPQVPLSNRFETLEIEGEASGEAMEDLPRREPTVR